MVTFARKPKKGKRYGQESRRKGKTKGEEQ